MKKILIILLSLYNSAAFAASFKGYTKNTDSKHATFNETIERFTESKDDFLILFSDHASFYQFPKKNVDQKDFKSYLNKMIKNQKKVKADIDPVTTEIYKISDEGGK